MNFLQALILGVVQGLTEFLPVSSSAHLALVPYWFQWDLSEESVFLFGVLVQMGTLISVIIYFWKDILQILGAFFNGIFRGKPFEDPKAHLGWMILLATVPAAVAGALMKDTVESAFNNPRAISVFLLVTAILLFAAEKVPAKDRDLREMNWKDAVWIGIAQAVALLPGISRSGATISGGLFRKFTRRESSRFAFLISIPIMIGAGALSVLDITDWNAFKPLLPALICATLMAAVVGYFAIKWMLNFINKRPFTVFSIYCFVVGIFTFILTFIR